MNNRYGVDVSYFKKELAALSRSLPDRTPDELSRYLSRLYEVAKPLENKERRKTVRAKAPCNTGSHEIADKLEIFYSTRPSLTRRDIHDLEAMCRQLRAGA